jgi:hypothetical protein
MLDSFEEPFGDIFQTFSLYTHRGDPRNLYENCYLLNFFMCTCFLALCRSLVFIYFCPSCLYFDAIASLWDDRPRIYDAILADSIRINYYRKSRSVRDIKSQDLLIGPSEHQF